MTERGEPSGAEAPAAVRIRVTCRWDPETRARAFDIDPPEAAAHLGDLPIAGLQPGDTASFALVMGEA